MMTPAPQVTVCLMRHGETDWNAARRIQGREDIELNERGREQARRAGLHLKQWTWDAVAASPLRRAAETARIIAGILGVELLPPMEAFIERDFGALSGRTVGERRGVFRDGEVPGLEPFDEVRARVMAGLEALRRGHPGRRLIVVAHGGVINAALSAISNGAIGSGVTRLENGSLTLLHAGPAGWEIEYFNRAAPAEEPTETNPL